MKVVGKSISVEQAADIMAVSTPTADLRGGGMYAQWLEDDKGRKMVLVQGMGGEVLQFEVGA